MVSSLTFTGEKASGTVSQTFSFTHVSNTITATNFTFNNSYTDSHARAAREGSWKYVVEEGETYLFNLSEDPGEQMNLAQSNLNLVGQMEKAYLSWEQDVTNGTPAN